MVEKDVKININTPEIRNQNSFANGQLDVDVHIDIPEIDDLEKRVSANEESIVSLMQNYNKLMFMYTDLETDVNNNTNRIITLEQNLQTMQQTINNMDIVLTGLVGKVSNISPIVAVGSGTNTANIPLNGILPFGALYRVSNGETVASLPIESKNGYIIAKRDCTIFLDLQVKMQFANAQTRYCYIDFEKVTANNVVTNYDGVRMGDHFTYGTSNTNRRKDFQHFLPAKLIIDLKANDSLSLTVKGIENSSVIYYGGLRDSMIVIMSDSGAN